MTHKLVPVEPTEEMITKEQALEALDSMDDFARMEVGVDPIGPRETLAKFIEQAPTVQAEPVAEVTQGKYGNRLMWASDAAQDTTPVGTKLYRVQPDAAAEIARLKDCRSIEAMQLETQRCTIAQQVEQLSLANLALENRGQIIEQHAERIKELEAEVAADWERRAECGRQLATANALIEAKDAELREIVEWAAVEKAPLRQQEIASIERVIALTGPDALKARDAATIRNVAAQLKADHGSWLGAARILSTIERMAEAVEKGEQL